MRLFQLLLLLLFAPATLSGAASPIWLDFNWWDISFGSTIGPQGPGLEATSWSPPPQGYGLTKSFTHLLKSRPDFNQGVQYFYMNGIYRPEAPLIDHFYLFIKANVSLDQLYFSIYPNWGWGNNPDAIKAKADYNWPLTKWNPGAQNSMTDWVKIAIPFSDWPNTYKDAWWIESQAIGVPVNVTIAGFFWTTDVLQVKTLPPLPTTIPIKLPNNGSIVESDGLPFNGTPAYLNWGQQFSGGPDLAGDLGENLIFVCTGSVPPATYAEAANVSIQAYRESNIGPVPMNMYKYAKRTNNDIGYATWSVRDLFSYPDQPWRSFDGNDFPHPGYVCSQHNADFIEIGNFSQAEQTIVVWIPELWYDQAHVTGAYAMYVLANKRPDGTDRVAVELRIRPPAVARDWGIDWTWVINPKAFNCSAPARWQCPDHIFFRDTQMGLLHTGLDWLYPLTHLESNYFQQHGYMATMDILPIIQKLTVYSEINYAIPFAVLLEPWQITNSAWPSDLLAPPPIGNWDDAWWEVWTIDKLNEYLTKMAVDKKMSNLWQLPMGQTTKGMETRWTNYLAFPYGGSVLDAKGRCGLLSNNGTEKALNETIVYWRSLSNWTTDVLINYRRNDSVVAAQIDANKMGVLSWRGSFTEGFQEWFKRKEPAEDYSKEPQFIFANGAGDDLTNGAMDMPPFSTQGFAFESNFDYFGGGFSKVYPATGTAYVGAVLVGMTNKTGVANWRKESVYDALMTAVARNKKVHFNSPYIINNNQGGVSGYISAKFRKGFNATGKQFYDPLIDRGMFAGSPVAQSMSYGLIEGKNPLHPAWNEILYKNVSVREALRKACRWIDNLTRPACTIDDYELITVDTLTTNKAAVHYKLKQKENELDMCNIDLANSVKNPPFRLQIPTQYVSSKSTTAKAMTGLSAACMVVNFILIIGFIVKRDAPVIRAAARPFSLMILLGGELTLASVILRTSVNDELDWPQCFGTYWFFAIGYALIIGSLGVKTYRVDRIFRNTQAGFKLTDMQLYVYQGVIVGGEIILLLIFQFVLKDPTRETTVPIPPTMEVVQKSCPTMGEVPSYLLYIWNALILLFAAVYAFRTRNVTSSYNENVFTVAAIGLITVISVVIVPVISLITQPDAIFLLISLGTIFGTILSCLVFAIPKLLTAWNILNFEDVRSIMTASISGKPIATRTLSISGTARASGSGGSRSGAGTGSGIERPLSLSRTPGATKSDGAGVV